MEVAKTRVVEGIVFGSQGQMDITARSEPYGSDNLIIEDLFLQCLSEAYSKVPKGLTNIVICLGAFYNIFCKALS